jgi:hypothetical protein
MSVLHEKVINQYRQYQEVPSYILRRHEYLFTQRSLEYRLKMSYDSITCWLRSVEEACTILTFQQRHLQETAAIIFQSFQPSHSHPNSDQDSDSSYAPSHGSSTTPLSFARTNSTASMMDWSTSSASSNSSVDFAESISTTSSVILLTPIADINSPYIPTGS